MDADASDESGVLLMEVPGSGHWVRANSSTSPLAGGATFTGHWVKAIAPDVMASCTADVSGTLYFDFSNDGGATYSTFPSSGFAVAASIHEFHTAVVGPRHFRVRYVNGSSAQTNFALYIYFGQYRQGNAPLNQTLGSDADAIVVRQVDPGIDLALGRLGGVQEDSKFGEVLALDAADAATDVWAFGSDTVSGADTKTFPTSAQSLYISSDSGSDTDVDVTVEYVDSTGAAATATPNLNGQTAVDMGVTAFDVNRARVVGDTAAVGNIYINTANAHTNGVPDSAATVLAYIAAGYGQTQLCMYTVPLNKQARLKHIVAGMSRASGGAGSAELHLRVREFGGTWIVKRIFHPTQAAPVDQPLANLVLPARTSFALRAHDVSDTDTNITGDIFFDIIDA